MTKSEKKHCLERYRTEQKELGRFRKAYDTLVGLDGLIGNVDSLVAAEAKQEISEEKVRLCRFISQMLRHKRQIERGIDGLADGTQALILRYRYIDGLNWEEISEELNYSFRSIHYMHNKALEQIAI